MLTILFFGRYKAYSAIRTSNITAGRLSVTMKLLNNVSAFLIAIVMVHGAPLSTDTSASLSNNGVAQRSPESAALAPGNPRDTLLGRDTNGEVEDTQWDEELEKRGLGRVIAGALARLFSKGTVSAGADTAAQEFSVPEVQTRGLRGSPSSKPNKGNGEASSWDQDIANEILSSLIEVKSDSRIQAGYGSSQRWSWGKGWSYRRQIVYLGIYSLTSSWSSG